MNIGLPAIALASIGTAAGIAYSVLGVIALKHLFGATGTDRTVGWSLWWWAERNRYTAEGQKLCRIGGALFLLGGLCWLAALLFWRP